MSKVEIKASAFELSDMDKEHRTAVIAHAVYDNIDRYGDICRKGMFKKTWTETKASDIIFDIDHDKKQQPGKVISTYENEQKAFTKVSFGNHTLGNDTMIMMDEGIIRGASFEFITEQKAFLNVKGKKVRELKEVKHLATTVTLALPPVNPLAGVVSVTKAGELGLSQIELKALGRTEFEMLKRMNEMDQSCLQTLIQLSGTIDQSSDLFTWVLYQISRRADAMSSIRDQLKYNSGELKAMAEHADKLEKFCRDTTASDDCILMVQAEAKGIKELLSEYDTSFTRKISEPDDSRNDSFYKQLLLLNAKS